MNRLIAGVYFSALAALLIVGGGLLYLRWMDVPGPNGDDRPAWTVILSVIGGLSLTILSTGIVLQRRHARRFLFGNVLFVAWLPLTLGVVEFIYRPSIPAWPALALHGVAPEVGRKAWGLRSDADGVGINSWGQHDRERSLRTAAGAYRIAFIGDSFLEESSQPVSLATERLLARTDCEILNLGVSATQPDEYYYRLRSVALPLGCRHCVVWLFSGNDFVDEPRTLTTRYGLFAAAPRPAWATAVGCRSINHILTNNDRPVLRAWFAAGDLAQREQQMYQTIRQADDETLRSALLNSSPLTEDGYARLKTRLFSAESASFFSMLREPDAGKFRSYYLTAGLWSAAAGNGQWDRNPESQALYWARAMQEACRRRNIRLTFVVIPEAFQVDGRMRDQWAPLTDMRHLTCPCREAAERFCTQARQAGLDVLDLHPAFEDVPGTYLNLDGHWSPVGVDLAAQTVLEHLRPQLPSR